MSTDLEHIERDQAIIRVLDRGFDLFNREIAALRADVDKLRADLASLMAVLRAGRERT